MRLIIVLVQLNNIRRISRGNNNVCCKVHFDIAVENVKRFDFDVEFLRQNNFFIMKIFTVVTITEFPSLFIVVYKVTLWFYLLTFLSPYRRRRLS